jgi:superfamily II DNA/RNA helicase
VDGIQLMYVIYLKLSGIILNYILYIKVSHVVNFEMPLFIADYLHRIGRVGRLGSVDGGIITNYVTKAYEADLVKNIER